MSSRVLYAYCTFPNDSVADEICTVLVKEGLVACANVIPQIRSIYQWGGQLVKENEVAAILKTSELKREILKERIRGIHPYSMPALVFLPVEDGLTDFLRWVSSQTL